MKFSGKKLLILGGKTESGPMVVRAKDMGVITYVADPEPNSPAKAFADHPVLIDGFDVDGLCALIERENIDGVMIGNANVLVPSYQKICERMKKHCYVTPQLVALFNNKRNFKKTLARYGLPVIPEYQLTDNMEFPVIVKPADASGSRGITVCSNASELQAAYEKAIRNSPSRDVIIEKYLDATGFMIRYLCQDGNIMVATVNDRHFSQRAKGRPATSAAAIYPSMNTKLYFATVHDAVVRMLKDNDLRNGVTSFQGLVHDGQIFFHDPSLRLGAGQPHLILERLNDLDLLGCLVNFAFTGKMAEYDISQKIDCYLHGKYVVRLNRMCNPGKVEKISGIEQARKHPDIFSVTQRELKNGYMLPEMVGTAAQQLISVNILTDSVEKVKETVDFINNTIMAHDETGKNLLFSAFDINFEDYKCAE